MWWRTFYFGFIDSTDVRWSSPVSETKNFTHWRELPTDDLSNCSKRVIHFSPSIWRQSLWQQRLDESRWLRPVYGTLHRNQKENVLACLLDGFLCVIWCDFQADQNHYSWLMDHFCKLSFELFWRVLHFSPPYYKASYINVYN